MWETEHSFNDGLKRERAMLQRLMIPKDEVICIPETFSCQQAVELLEEHELRNAPVVDETGNLFRGNIYRYHIYKYKFHHPHVDMSTFSVTYLLKNATKTIQEKESTLRLLFSIRDLPYLAVLNEKRRFIGIVKHETVLDYFQQAWMISNLSCIVAIRTIGERGDLRKISRVINRYCDIAMAMTLEETSYNTQSTMVYGVPKSVDMMSIKKMIHYLDRHHYRYDVFYF